MKLSELIVRCKIQIPNIKDTGFSDTELGTLLSQSVDEINLYTRVYKTYTDFNIVANQQIYNLSSIGPSYLGMDDDGVFFKNADGDWKEVYASTLPLMRSQYPDYLNADSADIPLWYWVEGNDLGFYNTPNTSKTNGGRIYHLKKSTPMGADGSYPFTGTTTEITAFRPLDDAMIAYVRWKMAPAFGTVTDQDLRQKEFILECQRGAKQVKRRPDLLATSTAHLRLC